MPDNGSAPDSRRGERSLVGQMVARISRDSLYYGIATTAVFPLSLLMTAINTRFLSITAFGRLSILFFFAGMLTIFLDLFVLRGIQRSVWGADEEGLDMENERPIEASRRPVTLGTGLVLTFLICAAGGLIVFLFSDQLARLLLHTPKERIAVIWMGASAALGGMWRVVTNVARWERRQWLFGLMYVTRPVFALLIMWPLLIAGFGVSAVLAATALGTLLSMIVGLGASRKSYKLAFNRAALVQIVRADIPLIPMVAGLSILHDADVFVLALVHSTSAVGLFRVASRLTSIVSYAVSAFTLAWAPLENSSLFRAAYQRHGTRRLKSKYTTYYLVVGGAMVLLLSVGARPMLAVIAPHYGKAVPLIPATGVGYLSYGLLIIVARTATFPARGLVHGISAVLAAGTLFAVGIPLGRAMGGYGVVLGDLAGAAVGVTIYITVASLTAEPPPIDVVQVSLVLLIAGGCYALGVPVADRAGSANIPLKLAAIALYPLMLIATGVLGSTERSTLRTGMRMLVRPRSGRHALIRAVLMLPQSQQRLLLAATRDRQPLWRLTVLSGLTEHGMKGELVAALRALTGTGRPGRFDAGIGELLLSEASVTERDELSKGLMDAGVRAADLHSLSSAFEMLRAAPAKAWSAILLDPSTRLPPPPWPLNPTEFEIVRRVIREREPRQLVIARDGIHGAELDHRLVGALRALAGLQGDSRADRLLAAFLFDGADRPDAEQLWDAGVDPLELHELELRAAAIRALPEADWAEIAGDEFAERRSAEADALLELAAAG